MQEHALESQFRQSLVGVEVAVFVVTGDRITDVGQMDPYLMRSSRLELCVQKAIAGKIADQPEYRVGLLALFVSDHPALPGRGDVLVQCDLHIALGILPFPEDQRQVMLAYGAFAQLCMQSGQGSALLRQDQNARRIAIQPVHQLQEAQTRASGAQLLNDPARYSAAAVHGNAAGFVDHQQIFVLE